METTPIKAILFDVDGIIIRGRQMFFSERLSKEYGVPSEAVQEFFQKEFRECTFGKADLKERIEPYLSKWNWKGTVDDLLTYWFESESTKDEEVLEMVKGLRSRGIRCYIATRQEKYRMQYLLDVVGLREHFDGFFCTCDIGSDKSEPGFFMYVVENLNVEPAEILFFDDTLKNIEVAKEFGIQAHYYDDIQVLKSATRDLLG